MKTKVISYWIATGVLEFVLLSGGIANLLHFQPNVDGLVDHLGYPIYFLSILGFWKVLGGIAILFPRFPRLQEWAYAGIFFELSGAVASHVAVGDGPGQFGAPLIFAMLAVVSWILRPASRRAAFHKAIPVTQ